MPLRALNDETIWGLPDARIAPALRGAEAFSETPLLSLVLKGASIDRDATALVGRTDSLRFKDLPRIAQKVACAIADRVPPGGPVACVLPRTPEAMAALIGCMISGRLCLVLDQSNPADRQVILLEDAAPALLLLAEPLGFLSAVPVLTLDDAVAGPDREWLGDHAWDPDAPFVIYFTSGSSGRPKGIVLSARAMLTRALQSAESWELTPADRVFAPSIHGTASGLGFLLGALTRGCRVVLPEVARHGAGAALRLAEREMVTCAAITPSILRVMIELERARSAFRWLRSLRIGAAALPRSDLEAWRGYLPTGCSVSHTYASTEAIIVASWVVPPGECAGEATVAAGLLQPCHEYALLDEHDRPVPIGQPGELVLRSRHVALGEWQGGQLVLGRFPPVPDRPGWRFFRTGDRLVVRPDGMPRVLGRIDRQVKINAVRVEPAEVEAVLRAEPGVTEAAVVATASASGVTLHGFIAASGVDRVSLIGALRQRLAASLPSALRPAHLIVLDRLPTLPSGKIDLMALSDWKPFGVGGADPHGRDRTGEVQRQTLANDPTRGEGMAESSCPS